MANGGVALAAGAIAPAATPFGGLRIDPLQPDGILAGVLVPASGQVAMPRFVPASVPLGLSFATQAIVFDGVALAFGIGSVFTVH